MELKNFRKKLEKLMVRLVGERIGWYYDSLRKGALRIIIEQEQIATSKGLFKVELEEDYVLFKGKIPFGVKLRHVTIWKFIPEQRKFGKHIVPAEQKEVLSGRFERCVRSSTKILFEGVYTALNTIESPCGRNQTAFSIDNIMLTKKEPMKVQLKRPHS